MAKITHNGRTWEGDSVKLRGGIVYVDGVEVERVAGMAPRLAEPKTKPHKWLLFGVRIILVIAWLALCIYANVWFMAWAIK